MKIQFVKIKRLIPHKLFKTLWFKNLVNPLKLQKNLSKKNLKRKKEKKQVMNRNQKIKLIHLKNNRIINRPKKLRAHGQIGERVYYSKLLKKYKNSMKTICCKRKRRKNGRYGKKRWQEKRQRLKRRQNTREKLKLRE